MTSTKHVHAKDCPDRTAADADRKQHAAAQMKRQLRLQVRARAEWLDWLPPRAG
jgi:hypothetical protein